MTFCSARARGICAGGVQLLLGSPFRIKGKTFEKAFALVY
jgi:hypothetical protein